MTTMISDYARRCNARSYKVKVRCTLHALLRNMHVKVAINWPEVITTQVDPDVDLTDYTLRVLNSGYAHVNTGMAKGTLLHRMVMKMGKGDRRQVDHINGDKFDNRRANLRIVSGRQNTLFQGLGKNNTTGLKGVVKLKSGRFRAQIGAKIQGRSFSESLGSFATKEEAGLAYDRAALARFAGAYLNFPGHVHETVN